MTGLLSAADSVLIVIDVQDRLVPAIAESDSVVGKAAALAHAAGLLGVPSIATEQAPDGIGRTVPAVAQALPGPGHVEKTHFDATRAAGFDPALAAAARSHAVVCGMEAHVCVLQTVFGLLRRGMTVSVVADAVGSRAEADRRLGLDRMAAAGVQIVSTEMVLFEWLERSDRPEFRAVHRLIK